MLCDHLTVAFGHAFLCTEQTKGRGDLAQASNQQVARPPEQFSVGRPPVFEIEEDIAQLENRAIRNAVTGQQPLNSLFRRSCPGISAHAGPIRTDANVRDATDAMKSKQADKFLGSPAAVA